MFEKREMHFCISEPISRGANGTRTLTGVSSTPHIRSPAWRLPAPPCTRWGSGGTRRAPAELARGVRDQGQSRLGRCAARKGQRIARGEVGRSDDGDAAASGTGEHGRSRGEHGVPSHVEAAGCDGDGRRAVGRGVRGVGNGHDLGRVDSGSPPGRRS